MNNLKWNVYLKSFNGKEIEIVNIFDYGDFYDDCVVAKKTCKDFESFSEKVRVSLMYYFWSRFEYETMITSWPVYITKQELDRVNEGDIKVRTMVSPETCVKVDVYDQLMLNWDIFIEYLWNNKKALNTRKK